MSWLNSPFIVPVVAMLIPIVAIVAGALSQAQARRVKADQRMAMLARGIPLGEVEMVLNSEREKEEDRSAGFASGLPMRRLHNSRRAALVLMSVGVGLMVFFVLLEVILHVREVLAGAAAGLIPFAIGVGFLIDYNLQKRDAVRLGLEAGVDVR